MNKDIKELLSIAPAFILLAQDHPIGAGIFVVLLAVMKWVR